MHLPREEGFTLPMNDTALAARMQKGTSHLAAAIQKLLMHLAL